MIRRDHLLALAVPALLAIGYLLPHVLRMGFLSDDYVLTNLLDADGASASWSEIGHQFSERWLYSQAYWRPIVNVVYGLNVDLLGFTPLALGLVNLLMHVTVVVATAHLCFRLCGGRNPVLAAWFGGAFVALHPATVETVLWISARVTGVEVFFRMLALSAFLAHLRAPSRGRYALVVLLSALALGSKESAVVLPAALLAVDLLEQPRRGLRARVRLHAPLLGLWIGYAVVRISLLGSFVGSPVPEPTSGQLLSILAPKLERLFVPAAAGWLLVWVVAWIAAVLLSAPLARDRRPDRPGRWAALVLLAWIAACLAPTYKTPLGAGFVGTRMLYDALPVVGLLIAYAIGNATRLVERAAAVVTAAVITVMLIGPADEYARSFEHAWEQNATARSQLEEIGRGATSERPLGILSFPPCRAVPGPIHPVSYFVTCAPPFAPAPIPAVGLGALLDRFPFSAGVYQDPRPAHALLDAGGTIVRWDEGTERMIAWRRDAASVAPRSANGATLRFDEPLHPLAAEALEVVTDAGVRDGSIVWLTSVGELGGPAGLSFAGGVLDGDARRFPIDATRHAPLLALAMAGGAVLGVRVETSGDGAVREVRAAPRLPQLPLSASLAGRRIPFDDLDGAMVAPAGDPATPMWLVLAGQATTFIAPVRPGEPVVLPDDVRVHIRMFANALGAQRFWYWFEVEAAQGEPGSARSGIDRFAIVDVPR